MASPSPPEHYRFGSFELQPDNRRLLKDGATISLRRRAFDLLAALRMLGQYYALFVEPVEVAPARDFAAALREASRACTSCKQIRLMSCAVAALDPRLGRSWRVAQVVRHSAPRVRSIKAFLNAVAAALPGSARIGPVTNRSIICFGTDSNIAAADEAAFVVFLRGVMLLIGHGMPRTQNSGQAHRLKV